MNWKIGRTFVISAVLVAAGLASAQALGRHGVGSGPVEINVYAADPATGVEPIGTLILDRPLTPAEIVANYPDAAVVVVTGENFSRTLDLGDLEVEISLYAEDPASGAEPVATIAAMQPLDLRELLAGNEDAAFAIVTGSDFTRTLDLAAMAEARERFEQRRDGHGLRGRGDVGPGRFRSRDSGPRNFGPRNFGPRNFGPRNFGPRNFGPAKPVPGDGT